MQIKLYKFVNLYFPNKILHFSFPFTTKIMLKKIRRWWWQNGKSIHQLANLQKMLYSWQLNWIPYLAVVSEIKIFIQPKTKDTTLSKCSFFLSNYYSFPFPLKIMVKCHISLPDSNFISIQQTNKMHCQTEIWFLKMPIKPKGLIKWNKINTTPSSW